MTLDDLLAECDRAEFQKMPAFVLAMKRNPKRRYGERVRIGAGFMGDVVGSDRDKIFAAVSVEKARAFVAKMKARGS